MTVRAKFRVYSKTPTYDVDKNINGYTIHLGPVYDPDPNSENGRFYKYTPGGQITLSTVNVEAADQLDISKEYYVDFHSTT